MPLPQTQFVEALDRWGGPLAAWLRGRCDNPDDVVQETFCRLLQQSKLPDRIAPWLFRVAGNLAHEQLRRAKRRRSRESQVAQSDIQHESPSRRLESDEVRHQVTLLPLEYREVIIARLWGELTLNEIAELLHTSTTTVHRRFEEGLSILKSALEANTMPSKVPHASNQRS